QLGKLAAQAGEFLQRLLYPVLAKDAVPGGECRAHHAGWVGLADRDQRYRVDGAARAPCRCFDSPVHGRQVSGDHLFHNGSIPGKYAGDRCRAAQDCLMSARFYHLTHYRAPAALAASLSLLLGGCTATRVTQSDAVAAQLPQPVQEASANPDGGMDTETTIWQLVGIAKKPEKLPGPETGPGVSPILWQATTDTLAFADFESQDPRAGLIVTKWYSPKGKPNDRLRIT